jgi:hypothetical protein
MLGWTEPYYKDVASLLLRLALNAPGEDGPIRSSTALMARMDPELLVRLYEHDPDRRREAEALVGRDQARAVKGAIGRFANFFAAVQGGFDAAKQGWSFEDVDFAYLRAPYLAGREDADACMRLLLEDFAHYATLRKPRKGEDATLLVDEFSAITGGRETAIQLTERVRDAGCAVYLSAQSADGWGTNGSRPAWSAPAPAACSSMRCPTPSRCSAPPASSRWWSRPGGWTPTGRPATAPPHRGAPTDRGRGGAAGPRRRGVADRRRRYEHLMVARTRISDGYRARAHALVALARSWRPQEVMPGARTWAEAQEE